MPEVASRSPFGLLAMEIIALMNMRCLCITQ